MSCDPEDHERVKAQLLANTKPWYDCTEDVLADAVTIWHMLSEAAPSVDCPLHEFLGMTEQEYAAWVTSPEAAKSAAKQARQGR